MRREAAFFNVGDIVTYGKYQNRKAIVRSFRDDGKGNPLVELEPIPKGHKKNKLIALFKIRHVQIRAAPKVAARYLNLLAVREAMTRSAADDMNAILLKLRKGVTTPIESINKLKKVLEHLGGWTVEPCVGLRRMNPLSKPDRFIGTLEEVQEVHAIAKRLEVSSLPRTSHPDRAYTRVVQDIEPFHQGFQVNFELWVGAAGFRITAPNGKTFEALPSTNAWRNQMGADRPSDLRKPLPALGNKPKLIAMREVVDWVMKETDFKQQVLDALGMEAHEKAQPRTQENTGSCPCCFRNIKLKAVSGQEHPMMVSHGYKRPGWGSQVGNCFGVGYPPFELSSLGTEHLIKDQLRPRLQEHEEYLKSLDRDDLVQIPYRETKVERGDPQWGRALATLKYNVKNAIDALTKDIEVLSKLVAHWKLEPLPVAGKPAKNWKALKDR